MTPEYSAADILAAANDCPRVEWIMRTWITGEQIDVTAFLHTEDPTGPHLFGDMSLKVVTSTPEGVVSVQYADYPIPEGADSETPLPVRPNTVVDGDQDRALLDCVPGNQPPAYLPGPCRPGRRGMAFTVDKGNEGVAADDSGVFVFNCDMFWPRPMQCEDIGQTDGILRVQKEDGYTIESSKCYLVPVRHRLPFERDTRPVESHSFIDFVQVLRLKAIDGTDQVFLEALEPSHIQLQARVLRPPPSSNN